MDAHNVTPAFDTDSEEEAETSKLQRRISDAILESSLEKDSPLKDSERLCHRGDPGSATNNKKGRRSLKETFQSVPDEDQEQAESKEGSSPKHQLTLVPLEEVQDLSSEEDFPSLDSLLSSPKVNSESPSKGAITEVVKIMQKEEIPHFKSGSVGNGDLKACSEEIDGGVSDLTKCHVVLEDVLDIIVDNAFLCEKRRKFYRVSNMDKFLSKVKAADDQESESELNIMMARRHSKHERSYRRAVMISSNGEESSEDEVILPMLRGKARRVIPVSKRKRFKRSTGRRRLPVKSIEFETSSSDDSLEMYEEGDDVIVHHKPPRKRKSPRRMQRRPLIRRAMRREALYAIEEDTDNSVIQDSDSSQEKDILPSSYFNFCKDDPELQSLKVLMHPIPDHVLQKWSIVV